MHIASRSYLTGIAALGVGAVALAPIQPLPDHVAAGQTRAVESLAVNLASTIDPITPWVTTFQTAVANFQLLSAYNAQQPLPLLTTWGKNQVTYLKELFGGQAAAIPGQIWHNVTTLLEAPWWNQDGQPIVSSAFSNQYVSTTQTVQKVGVLVNSEGGLYGAAAPLIAKEGPAWLTPVLQYTATHLSAQTIGLIGPLLAPLVQLTRSFTAVGQFVQNGDLIGAINELINIPANVTNAVLNGVGPVDLTEVAKNVLPPSVAQIIQAFGVNLGGILSPPVPYNGSLTNVNKPPTVFTGGTLFDVVSARATISGIGAETTGLPVGITAANISMNQFLGTQLLVTPPAPTAAAPAAAALEAPAPEVEAPAAPAAVDIPESLSAEAPEQDSTPAPAPAHAARGAKAAADDDNGGAGASSGARGHRGAN